MWAYFPLHLEGNKNNLEQFMYPVIIKTEAYASLQYQVLAQEYFVLKQRVYGSIGFKVINDGQEKTCSGHLGAQDT